MGVHKHSTLARFCCPQIRNTQNVVGDMMPLCDISVVNVLNVVIMHADILKLKMDAIVLKVWSLLLKWKPAMDLFTTMRIK